MSRARADAAYTLVATDLDGTLLRADGSVGPRTRRALDLLDARGVTVVFVTGRPVRWMESLWPHVGGHGVAVCSNGAVVYDVGSHAIVRSRTIDRAACVDVARTLRRELPGTSFAVERTDGFGREPSFERARQRGVGEETADARREQAAREAARVRRDSGHADLTVASLEDLAADERVVKLLAHHPDAAPEDFWRRVEALVGDRVTTTWSSVGTLVEMSGLGVTKATTVELLCADRGIAPEEVVAFGDMPNDVAMLAWAGTSYAMADAHPLVREAAGHLAPPHDEEGVARVLEDLFALGPGA